jgi:hypothetical protein
MSRRTSRYTAQVGCRRGAAGNRTVRRVLVRYSRLQKSERRIFPVAIGAAARLWPRAGDSLKRTSRLDEAGRDRGRRQGAGRGCAREQQAGPSPPGLQSLGRTDGRRTGLRLSVVLTRRRSRRIWRSGSLDVAVPARAPAPARGTAEGSNAGGSDKRGHPTGCAKARDRSPCRRIRGATEGARSSHIRSGFLSRWAQEVGGCW